MYQWNIGTRILKFEQRRINFYFKRTSTTRWVIITKLVLCMSSRDVTNVMYRFQSQIWLEKSLNRRRAGFDGPGLHGPPLWKRLTFPLFFQCHGLQYLHLVAWRRRKLKRQNVCPFGSPAWVFVDNRLSKARDWFLSRPGFLSNDNVVTQMNQRSRVGY